MTDNGRITWTNETRKLSELIPWPRNPRQIKADQVKRLQESLDEFGQPETIAIGPGNEIYNGHQRLKSWADKYGDIEVDVRVASRALTEKEREKLTVFLHKGAAGEWNFDILANEFEVDDLLDWGFEEQELDLDLWGVDEPPEDPGAQIDRAEELREKWGVESGQLWKLGEHRLICGDCTDAGVVARLMDGEKAGAVVTDPPYGIGLDTNYSKMGHTTTVYAKIEGDDKPFDPKPLFELFDTKQYWLWGADNYYRDLPDGGSLIVWAKAHKEDENEVFGSSFEICWTYPKRKREIWFIRRIHMTDQMINLHPTQKPLECMERPIRNSNDGIILDPFLGSGTTLIACERLGRKCRAVEISPAYCAVAIQRWADMTGQEPELVTE